jgi:hypothetical protein
MFSLIFLIVILGRFLTCHIGQILGKYSEIGVVLVSAPHHLLSSRTDLACHDIYSYILGVLVVMIVYFPLRYVWNVSRYGWTTLTRKNAIRRASRDAGHAEADTVVPDIPAWPDRRAIIAGCLSQLRRLTFQVSHSRLYIERLGKFLTLS